ncbi:MAG: hypothetical protein HOI92_08530 [Alphaproteobacteria bacterium]|jgi:hypothetical protein|nr:hypothetical protein [Alphaproteobacteria bacterium]MDG2465589.1 hypothetical protein [Alphaproteobacteria bacterium]
MSDINNTVEKSQEDRLVEALKVLLKDFPDYDPPRIRMDGDIVIPLDVLLKKNREASRGMAEAISNMMNGDRKKRSAWVK